MNNQRVKNGRTKARRSWFRPFCFWLIFCMLPLGALGAESDFPELNAEGFLDEGEFVYFGDDEGLWRYASATLWVEVRRIIQEKPARTWYEAEIRCAEGADVPHMIANDPEKGLKSTEYPHKIARKNGTVIAVSNDYAQLRYKQKSRMGIVIRDGKIWSEKTRKKGANQFPTLDTLALFPDGDMRVFDSDELTAQEYLEMGARDVLAFGPWLIRDGELNETALAKYGKSKAERVAVGMVEKGHYWFMMLEGRITRSKGDGITFLAEKLRDKRCTVAFNLDGGQTACIVFMGHQLCKMTNSKGNKASRITADILGVGVSELTPAVGDPW
ncbi:MAG: phosphodiester glycosidase family protein [Clostridia bacterium]|nr:phosphodiester glycosidase family protein [Clostridia bacterium]